MIKNPALLFSMIAMLALTISIVIFRECRFQRRLKEAEQDKEKFKQSIGLLKRVLDDNPNIDLRHQEVQELAQNELDTINAWLADHPEQACHYHDQLDKLKRILALNKPSH